MHPAPGSPRLLTQVRQTIRLHQYSRRTEEAYVGWVRRYVRFSGMRHPAELGAEDVRRFLTALADRGGVSVSTQTQALSGLLFLYRQVLGRELDSVAIVRPAKPVRLPVVLGRGEVRVLLSALSGTPRLVAMLLYGSGLRLLEALQLRVKDLDFTTGEIVVRRGKGAKDRITMMADSVHDELAGQLERVRRQHQSGPGHRWRLCGASGRLPPEVSGGSLRMGVAVCVSLDEEIR